jgi:demethylmenaquinone methyltransferase/2-methoxy-6-polyprenyl-1,4-benzoquinol methylase
VTQFDRTREHLIETYRKKAKHYDITSRLYPAPGYPQRAQRLRAVQALGLRAGDSVIDIACGTGLNFPLIEEVIGPGGRIVGVDLTDAMLAHAQDRIETNNWSNISLVRPVAGARVRRGHRPRRRGPFRRRTLGRAGSQGSRQHAWVASAPRNRDCAAFRLHR